MSAGASTKSKPKRVENHRYRRLRESGLTIEALAKKLDYSPGYLRAKFAKGKTPYILAQRLAREIGCRMEVFL